jgi:hypothetical protein
LSGNKSCGYHNCRLPVSLKLCSVLDEHQVNGHGLLLGFGIGIPSCQRFLDASLSNPHTKIRKSSNGGLERCSAYLNRTDWRSLLVLTDVRDGIRQVVSSTRIQTQHITRFLRNIFRLNRAFS